MTPGQRSKPGRSYQGREPMRLILLLAVVLSSGCKSAEIALDHQISGLHVAAKFEAKDHGNDWNGGDQLGMLRR
jgi:hypothetical protein